MSYAQLLEVRVQCPRMFFLGTKSQQLTFLRMKKHVRKINIADIRSLMFPIELRSLHLVISSPS